MTSIHKGHRYSRRITFTCLTHLINNHLFYFINLLLFTSDCKSVDGTNIGIFSARRMYNIEIRILNSDDIFGSSIGSLDHSVNHLQPQPNHRYYFLNRRNQRLRVFLRIHCNGFPYIQIDCKEINIHPG